MKRWNIRKNNLDEMQEQKLLHIEKNCFWILYVMLFIVIVIQKLMGKSIQEFAGEFICFMIVSVILVVSCIYNGIWDRHLKADRRTNLWISFVGAVVVAIINGVFCVSMGYVRYGVLQFVLILMIPAVITFIVTMLLLSICTNLYKKRLHTLEEKEND